MCTLYFYLEELLEYGVFIKFYSKLTMVLRNKDYLPHLVTARIVAPNNIHRLSDLSNDDRAMHLLEYISDSLVGGEKGCFYRMLEILQEHGNLHAQSVAEEIKNCNLGSIARTKSDSIGSVASNRSARSDSMGSVNTPISEGKMYSLRSINLIYYIIAT